jgi:predicted HAD superfamily Cof-like phosphohydrolase
VRAGVGSPESRRVFGNDGLVTDAPFDPTAALRESHGAWRLESNDHPTLEVPDAVKQIRCALIEEEAAEFRAAVEEGDLVEVADAIADLLYVVYGAALTFGVPADEVFSEVHRSNMTKLGADGLPIYREDGKVLKGPNYSPPDLLPILARHARRPEDALDWQRRHEERRAR